MAYTDSLCAKKFTLSHQTEAALEGRKAFVEKRPGGPGARLDTPVGS